MIFGVAGINHQVASIDIRESAYFSVDEIIAFSTADEVTSNQYSPLILSTCNRVELYVLAVDEKNLDLAFEAFIQSKSALVQWQDKIYQKTGRDALKHFIRVASGVDSLVVGEPQIFGQIKDSYFLAQNQKCLSSEMDRLIQNVFRLSKKVRSETGIGGHAISVSYVAATIVKRIFEELHTKKVLILGAGEIAELCAQNMTSKGIKEITFATRTYEHAKNLADQYHGRALQLEDREQVISQSDIVIVSTAAPNYLIDPIMLRRALENRKYRPLLVIDLSVPRNVDPAISDMEDVYLYNIDDLESIVDQNMQQRRQASQAAELLIDVESQRAFEDLMRRFNSADVISRYVSKAQGLRDKELSRLRSQLSSLKDDEWAMIEKSFFSLTQKLIHPPLAYLSRNHEIDELEHRIYNFLCMMGLSEANEDREDEA